MDRQMDRWMGGQMEERMGGGWTDGWLPPGHPQPTPVLFSRISAVALKEFCKAQAEGSDHLPPSRLSALGPTTRGSSALHRD